MPPQLKPLNQSLTKQLPPPKFDSGPLPPLPPEFANGSQKQPLPNVSPLHKRPSLSGTNSKAKFKNYQVLGDYQEFEEKLEAVTVPPPPPPPDTVENVDPAEFPEDVWAAACISPDKGAAIIRSYREVVKTRYDLKGDLSSAPHHITQHMGISMARAQQHTITPCACKTYAQCMGNTW